MGIQRRQFTREFKLQVLSELKSGKSIGQVSREYQLRPSLLDRWRHEFKILGNNAFPGNGIMAKPEAKVAELERIIGQLTVENTLLKKVLRRLKEPTHPPASSTSEK
jgi:transposase